MTIDASLSPCRLVSPEEVRQALEDFHRDGVSLILAVLSSEDCELLRAKVDEVFAVKKEGEGRGGYNNLVIGSMAIYDRIFRDLLTREPMLGIAQTLLGKDCRYLDTVAVRNGPSRAIDFWHVDLNNYVEFPLPPEVPRHDPRIRMPVFWFSFQIALTDIESPEFGPTEFVPGSHYSGRQCPTQDNPHFEGVGPRHVICRAGDVYIFNHQTWHRGSPNRSDRVRYLLQTQYCNATMSQRFAGSVQHGITDAMLEGADAKLLTLLGKRA